jgi:hypothetical protein
MLTIGDAAEVGTSLAPHVVSAFAQFHLRAQRFGGPP